MTDYIKVPRKANGMPKNVFTYRGKDYARLTHWRRPNHTVEMTLFTTDAEDWMLRECARIKASGMRDALLCEDKSLEKLAVYSDFVPPRARRYE